MIRALLRNILLGGVVSLAAPLSSFAQDTAPPDIRPMRVVSINLCTDQLAMLLADPGQLLSVSYLAHDPSSSAMADEAHAFAMNHGRAEEIFVLKPDLVVAGAFSSRATVQMLRKLGLPVAVMQPAYSLADVRARIAEMGQLLHQRDRAAQMTARFDAQLAALREEVKIRPRAALYYANSYSSGDSSLAGQILSAAGFDNVAGEAGIPVGGTIPLEVLALLDPDVLISGRRHPAASRAEEVLDHPVVQMLKDDRLGGTITDRDWICASPHVLRAIAGLIDVRHTYESQIKEGGQ